MATNATGITTGADLDAQAVKRRQAAADGPNGDATTYDRREDDLKKLQPRKVYIVPSEDTLSFYTSITKCSC